MNKALSTLPLLAYRGSFAAQTANAPSPSPRRAGTAKKTLWRGFDIPAMLILLALISVSAAHAVDLHSASALRAGGKHVCALDGGALFCWGDNSYGQMGDGASNNTHGVPVPVAGLTGITEVAPGYEHNCVLASGAVKCSGRNNYGQLGDGSSIVSGSVAANATPLDVVGVSGATAVASGKNHSCALLSGGTVKCWGQNTDGQLGNNSQTDSSTPVDVSGISGATAIAAGYAHTCAILSGGAMKCWGSNSVGGLGTGSTTPARSLTPVDVTEASGVTAMGLGGFHTCAVVTGGSVKCWGWNLNGQLGDGTTTNSAAAITVSGVSDATSVVAGYWHSCAAVSGGGAKCWGGNSNGQLGDGSTANKSTAQTTLDNVTGSAVTQIASVTAGEYYTCSLLSTGKAKCWGYNNFGQLGNGYSNFIPPGNQTRAVSVTTPAGAPTAIVATPGNTQISVAFTAPSDLGSPVSENYSVVCTSSNGGTPRTLNSVTASPAVVTSLTNGKAYTCTVTAYNVVMGDVSVASNSVTPSANVAPTAGSVALSGTAKIGETLTGSYTYSDAESDAENTAADGSSYRIVRSTDTSAATTGDNADAVSSTATGGANQTYVVATADYGKYLFYCVTPKAGSGGATGTEVCSSAVGPVSRDAGVGDPVPDAFGSGTGDGNGDATLDWQQTFVASLPTPSAGGSIPVGKRWATFEAAPNTLTFSNVTNSTAPASLPRGKNMPLGKFGFSVSGLANGGTATLSLLVDSSLGMRGYLKQANGLTTWNDISTSTTVFGNKTKITFTLTDGGPYDADGVANGAIVDPGGAVLDLLNPVVAENTTYVGEMSAALALNAGFAGLQGAVTYTLTGADAAKFAIDATSGRLRFTAAPDYEAPASAASSNVYSLTVVATGATGGTASEAITVTVLNDMGTHGVIADLAGDRTMVTPGSAEFLDNDPTLAGVGVFSEPISGYLLIGQGSGAADGAFTLDGSTALPGTMAVDATLDGSSGKALKYALTAATADHLKTVLNNLKYAAPSAGERSFSVILNNGANASEAVTFTMIGNGNGACGAANGASLASAPSADLCAVGAATPVTGGGPWNWACVGSGTGANASCSASVAASPATPAGGASSYTPPANPTLPSGGGTVAPSGGQTVIVTDNGKEGSSISLPAQTTQTGIDGSTTTTSNAIKVELPGTGTVSASSTSQGAKLGVTSVILPGATTPVSAVTVDSGSASFTATKSGQAVAGLKNGIVVVSGASNSQVTVDTTGANTKIGVQSSDTIVVPVGAQNVSGTSVDLPAPTSGGAATPVNVSVGGKEISVQATQSNTTMTFKVIDIGGVKTPVVEVAGAAQVSSSGDSQPLVSVSGSVIRSGNGNAGSGGQRCNTIIQASSETSKDVVHVVTCYIVLEPGTFSALSGGAGNGFAAIKDGIVWAGETAEFDKNGQVTGAYLGSKDGNSDAVGDDIAPGGNKFTSSSYNNNAFIPRLSGTPLRLNGAKLDESLFKALNQVLGTTTTPATPGQSAQGVLSFHINGDATADQKAQSTLNFNLKADQVSVIPTRRIRVDTSRADGVNLSSEGDVEVASGGLVAIFAPSVGDPQAFAAKVAQALPGATSELRWNGAWKVMTSDGGSYVGRPAWNRQMQTGNATFASLTNGNVIYHDGGYSQMLVADFHDYTTLQGTFAKELNDAKLTVQPNMDGTATAKVNGKTYTLTPQWKLLDAAQVSGKPAWWLDNGVVYLKNADGTAQGFSVK